MGTLIDTDTVLLVLLAEDLRNEHRTMVTLAPPTRPGDIRAILGRVCMASVRHERG